MENSKLKRVVALVLSAMMVFCLFLTANPNSLIAASAAAEENESTTDEALEILGDDKWLEYKAKNDKFENYDGEDITINSSNLVDPETVTVEDYEGKKNVVFLKDEGSVSWKVNVPKSGLYAMDILYNYLDSEDDRAKAADIERTLRINSKVPYTELRNLVFTKKWIDAVSRYDLASGESLDSVNEETLAEKGYTLPVAVYENGNIVKIFYEKDGADNERRPIKKLDPEWTTYTVCDPTGNYNGEFYFYLEKGENIITLEAQKEYMYVDSIVLRKRDTLISYEEYKNMYKDKEEAKTSIKLEAEYFTSTSSRTIYGQNDRSSAITSPQHPSYSWINDVGGRNGSYNWASIGQWIEWTFTIPEGEAGMYVISSRFLQDAVEGLYVSRRIYIDGEVPFEEANNLQFLFDKSWQGDTFNAGDEDLKFYFSEGEHTIKLEVNYGGLGPLVAELRDCVTRINAIYVKILTISGSTPDPYMDYMYWSRMPDEIAEMGQIAKRLYAVSEQMKEISKGESSSSTATVENVARVLEKMSKDSEGQIAKNFAQLKSYIGNLGTWINNIGQQALILDYLLIQPAGSDDPRGEGNFFVNAWYEIQMFFYSFIRDNSSYGSAEAEEGVLTVDVWTTVSREYTQIIRTIIDQEFANERSNVAINLKLVTAGTLLPATLSGVGPDVMMDVTSSDCINYAVRGAVLDLTQFEGFDVVRGDGSEANPGYFHESSWVPFTVALGSSDGDIAVYGIPEKQSFNVMFYRKDIFANLGLSVPNTWDEFNAIMPILVSQNYDIGMSHDIGIFNTFVYQHGGELYTGGGTTISFDQDVTLDAFTALCKFFTTYNFPLKFDAANRFRSGEMPMFIGDYITYYNQFTVFAPELKGLWGFTTVPGTVQEDGSVTKTIVTTMNSIVIMMDAADRGTAQAGFDFIKWWMSGDIQGQYANELVALLGPAGKYATANIHAFKDMSWTSNELKEIQAQFDQLKGVPEMPGSYIIARNIEFAFLDVYNNDAVPSEALQDYTNTINAEFTRKREELNRGFFIPTTK
ncbi:MAG: extracellular solute-binding protein [Clostridia bacterium]|nr:extracellular solute-binding protein [Clostridia bacterium]